MRNNKIRYYLYNYKIIDNMIDERRTEIIERCCSNLNNYMKGINTVESQAIALIEDKKINELKRWQVYIKNILVFFRQKNPLLYKFIILKYFNGKNDEEIKKILKLNLRQIKYLDDKVINFLIKMSEKENMKRMEG